MADFQEMMADAVLAIKSDSKLSECFIRILSMGHATQQVRVASLQEELRKLRAPDVVLRFVALLSNEKLAQQVLGEIED